MNCKDDDFENVPLKNLINKIEKFLSLRGKLSSKLIQLTSSLCNVNIIADAVAYGFMELNSAMMKEMTMPYKLQKNAKRK